MPTVKKDVLRPGTYTLRDGSTHIFTEQDVRAAVANGRKMLRAGEAIPLIWEHDADAVPTPLTVLLSKLTNRRDWAADFARHCFGYSKDFTLEVENGKPVAYMTSHIPDAQDAARWKAARYCSPRVDRNYCDGQGRVYPGCSITHLAATPKPVQTNQFPVMLSATPGRKVPYRGTQTIFLSQETTMPEPKDDKGGKGGSSGVEARLKNVLATLGHTLPDSCADMESILIGLETIAANGGGGGAMMDDDDYDDDETLPGDGAGATAGNSPGDGTTSAVAPPMMMSKLGPLEKAGTAIIGGYRKQLVGRVERLCAKGMRSGVIDGEYARDLERRAKGAELSLTESGDLARTEFEAEIETVERLVNNAAKRQKGTGRRSGPAGNIDLSHLGIRGVRIPQPNGLTDEQNSEAVEKAKKAAEERMLKNHPPANVGQK